MKKNICILLVLLLCVFAFGACAEDGELGFGDLNVTILSDLLPPSVLTPETEAHETEALETEAPETEAPETEAPETEAPETEAPETEAPETEAPETEAPKAEQPTAQVSHVDEEGNIVWYLGKNGDDEYKVVVKPEAAGSAEYNNKDKSAHSVFLYDLSQSADEPVWSMHMCVGRGPSGGIAAHENGGLYIWYTDFWDKNGELWYTLVTYDLYIDGYGKAAQIQNGMIQGAVGEDTDMWYEMKRFDLDRGIFDISDMLGRKGMFVLLDVTGDEVYYSTPDNRFTYAFEHVGRYSEFRTAYENVGEFKKIVPID